MLENFLTLFPSNLLKKLINLNFCGDFKIKA